MSVLQSTYHSRFLIGISLISALGGYLFGFDFAVISGALPFLQRQFGLSAYGEGLVTGSLALGAISGCLLAGRIAARYGRRSGLQVAAGLFCLSAFAMALAPTMNFFIAGRFAAGISVGMASMLSPMYIAEISPRQMRGRMVAINQLTVVTGILVTNVIDYLLRNTGPSAWRWMFGLGAIPGALFFAGASRLPESPRWLVRSRRREAARIVLQRVSSDDPDESIRRMEESFISHYKPRYADLLRRGILPAILTGIGLAIFQQLCGINVVFNYTPRIFRSMGMLQDDQLLQTVFIGGVNLVFTILAMTLVDSMGRKPLMLLGAAALAVLYMIIGHLLAAGSGLVSWFLLGAIGIYALTLGPITWVLIAEIFPGDIRERATAIAVLFLWASYFILVFTFPILFDRMRNGIFYLYGLICLGGLIFVARIRETKGMALEDAGNTTTMH